MALTQATVDAAESAGCRTLLLVATDAGRPLYEKIGFEVQTWYRILEAPGLGDEPVDPRIRPYEAADLPAMAELSAAATGEDRTHLLAAFASPETSICLVRDDGALGGFVVRAPWGGGSTIAPRLGGRRGDPARASGRPRTGAQDPGRAAHRERGGPGAAARDGLDGVVAGPAADPRRAAALAARGHLGTVQPRPRLSAASGGTARSPGRTPPRVVQRTLFAAAEGVMVVALPAGMLYLHTYPNR